MVDYVEHGFATRFKPIVAGKVLIVEDDPDIRAGIVEMMRIRGFSPLPFGDGLEAIAALESHELTVALLDVDLPGMNGYEILKTIRRNPKHHQLPVIMVTGESADDQVLDGYQFGADYYITKPFNQKQLQYGLNLCVPVPREMKLTPE